MENIGIVVEDFIFSLPLVEMCFLMLLRIWKSELIKKRFLKVCGSIILIAVTVLLVLLFWTTAPFNTTKLIFIVRILVMYMSITVLCMIAL